MLFDFVECESTQRDDIGMRLGKDYRFQAEIFVFMPSSFHLKHITYNLSILEMRKAKQITVKGLGQIYPARKGKAGLALSFLIPRPGLIPTIPRNLTDFFPVNQFNIWQTRIERFSYICYVVLLYSPVACKMTNLFWWHPWVQYKQQMSTGIMKKYTKKSHVDIN